MEQQLISIREAAERIGVSHNLVREWIARSERPLPSVHVGASGKHRRVVVSLIESWLEAEAEATK